MRMQIILHAPKPSEDLLAVVKAGAISREEAGIDDYDLGDVLHNPSLRMRTGGDLVRLELNKQGSIVVDIEESDDNDVRGRLLRLWLVANSREFECLTRLDVNDKSHEGRYHVWLADPFPTVEKCENDQDSTDSQDGIGSVTRNPLKSSYNVIANKKNKLEYASDIEAFFSQLVLAAHQVVTFEGKSNSCKAKFIEHEIRKHLHTKEDRRQLTALEREIFDNVVHSIFHSVLSDDLVQSFDKAQGMISDVLRQRIINIEYIQKASQVINEARSIYESGNLTEKQKRFLRDIIDDTVELIRPQPRMKGTRMKTQAELSSERTKQWRKYRKKANRIDKVFFQHGKALHAAMIALGVISAPVCIGFCCIGKGVGFFVRSYKIHRLKTAVQAFSRGNSIFEDVAISVPGEGRQAHAALLTKVVVGSGPH